MRDHDNLYLETDRYLQPTELTKWTWRLIQKRLSSRVATANSTPIRILDVGCAAGEFLGYMQTMDVNAEFVGIDVADPLVAKARAKVPQADFHVGSVLDEEFALTVGGGWDLIVMKGVHGIFDDPFIAFNNLLAAATAGTESRPTTILIIGPFNPEPIDVITRYRLSESGGELQPGWNLISMTSVDRYLQMLEVESQWEWERFEIGIDVAPQDDPVRTYTITKDDGGRLITNGLQLVVPMWALVWTVGL